MTNPKYFREYITGVVDGAGLLTLLKPALSHGEKHQVINVSIQPKGQGLLSVELGVINANTYLPTYYNGTGVTSQTVHQYNSHEIFCSQMYQLYVKVTSLQTNFLVGMLIDEYLDLDEQHPI